MKVGSVRGDRPRQREDLVRTFIPGFDVLAGQPQHRIRKAPDAADHEAAAREAAAALLLDRAAEIRAWWKPENELAHVCQDTTAGGTT